MKIRIVDYQKEKKSVLNRIFKVNKVKVVDWMEKDYGVVLFATVPKSNFISLRNEIERFRNFEIEEDDSSY
jgi:hypothetical protein